MLGMQIGGGYGPVAGQFEVGFIYNDKHLKRYDTTYLGPYSTHRRRRGARVPRLVGHLTGGAISLSRVPSATGPT